MNQSTPLTNAVVVEKLSIMRDDLINEITSLGIMVSVYPGSCNLVEALDAVCSDALKNAVLERINDQSCVVFDAEDPKYLYTGSSAARNVITRNQPTAFVSCAPSQTQRLISAFASYQMAYGIPSEFGTIVRTVMKDGLFLDELGGHWSQSGAQNPYPGIKDGFDDIVKSSATNEMEFKRLGAGNLPVWDTIQVNDIINFLITLYRLTKFTHNEVEKVGRINNGLHRQMLELNPSHQSTNWLSSGIIGTIGSPIDIQFVANSGYIDFFNIRKTFMSLFGDNRPTDKIAEHVTVLHNLLLMVRAKLAIAQFKLEMETNPNAISEFVAEAMESATTKDVGKVLPTGLAPTIPAGGTASQSVPPKLKRFLAKSSTKLTVPKGPMQFRSATANAAAAGGMTTLPLRAPIKSEVGAVSPNVAVAPGKVVKPKPVKK